MNRFGWIHIVRLRAAFALVIAIVLALGATAQTARAQGPVLANETRARALYQSASAHFEAGRYIEAQADFSTGFELSRKPGFLWNMAECARLLGKNDRALELYRQYVAAVPASPQRADAQRRVRELEASKASTPLVVPIVPLTPAEEATLALASRRPSTAPQTAPAASTGPAATSSSTPMGVAVLAPAPAPRAKEGDKPITARWWFWTAAAGVAVAAIATTAIVANSQGGSEASPSIPSGNNVVSWR